MRFVQHSSNRRCSVCGACAYCIAVTSRDLSPEQLEKIAAAVGKRAAYFYALSGRCHQKCFPRDDALRVAADKVDAALRELAAVVALLDRHRSVGASESSPPRC